MFHFWGVPLSHQSPYLTPFWHLAAATAAMFLTSRYLFWFVEWTYHNV